MAEEGGTVRSGIDGVWLAMEGGREGRGEGEVVWGMEGRAMVV